MSSNKNSLNISGSSKYPGGEYDDVNISGNGKIEGDLICNKFYSSGMGKVIGNLKTNILSVDGTTKVCGSIEAKSISINGVFKCESDIVTKDIEINGMSKVEGTLKGENIQIAGVTKVESDIECENINIDGKFNCDGFVNCEKFQLRLNANSSVKELGASYINIQKENFGGFIVFNIFKIKKNLFECDIIEGDDIILENCNVKVVRGKNIEIKDNCKIDTLEYSESIKISEKSDVKVKNKI